MSKIALEGNASGTGTLTVAAPNTNTDYTLTLPTESGTILTNSGSGAASFATLTVAGSNISAANSVGFRNRIINGDMRIDQRNAGASVTPSADQTYTLDRWMVRNAGGAGRFSVVQSSTSAANFPISVLLTNTTTAVPSGSEFYSLQQAVEGYNMSDFGWGTANAKSVTISFRVRSSLTGTYCVSVRNSSGAKSFVSEYTISSANTFETKTVTLPGETSGTWNSTNGLGLFLDFCLGAASGREGTAGSWQSTNIVATTNQVDWINTASATFYLTGVQLEVGSVATEFERRPYGTELALCQRYFQTWGGTNNYEMAPVFGIGFSTNTVEGVFTFITTMRSTPTLSTAGTWGWLDVGAFYSSGTLIMDSVGLQTARIRTSTSSSITQYRPYQLLANNSTAARLQLSAEL